MPGFDTAIAATSTAGAQQASAVQSQQLDEASLLRLILIELRVNNALTNELLGKPYDLVDMRSDISLDLEL